MEHVEDDITCGCGADPDEACSPDCADIYAQAGPTVGKATRANIARIAEVVIGLGVASVEGCKLCDRADLPCPKHVGEEIARQVWPLWAC